MVEQVKAKSKGRKKSNCSTMQQEPEVNSTEGDAISKRMHARTRTALAPFSRVKTNATHEMDREQRGHTINDALSKEGDEKFASMGTWKIVKKVSKD